MDTSLFDKAASFAIQAHAGVTRKGSRIPYVLHCMEAAMITASMTEDPEVLAAALLHDVVEDTPITVEEVRREFGDRVAYIVEHESIPDDDNDRKLSMKERERLRIDSWRARKELALKRVAEGDMDTKMVAMGDKLSNLRAINRDYETIGDALWERFRTHDPKAHEWYYRSMADSLRDLAGTVAYQEYMYLLHRTFKHMPPSEQMTLDLDI